MTNPRDPMHEIETHSFLKRFKRGDVLAAFECCDYWRRCELDYRNMPVEFLAYLCDGGADYSVALGPGSLGKLPSLDKIMSLSGTQKTPNAAKKRDRVSQALSIQDYIDHVVAHAGDRGNVYTSPMTGKTAKTLYAKRPTRAFQTLVAEDFHIGRGRAGAGWGESGARTMQRLLIAYGDK